MHGMVMEVIDVLNSKSLLVVAAVMVGAYLVFTIMRLLKPAKSDYEKDIDHILHSDKYKVKGRFED